MTKCKAYVCAALALLAVALGGCAGKRAATKPTKGSNRMTHVVPSSNREVAKLVAEARKWIGTPYVYGGHSRSGTDCSGMVMELFREVYKMKLPRSSAMQQQYARPVKKDEMMPGDLVFFATGAKGRVSHVGLYIGDGLMIHASASKGVMESPLTQNYWVRTFHSSGRVVETDPRHPEKSVPAVTPPPATELRLQQLYDALDSQIDSLYVSDPEIFD